jgi:hypothetical protein
MKHFRKSLVVLAVALGASATWAEVSINAAGGFGWVGKGDVQQAYGWNNKTLQTNAQGVSFEVKEHQKLTIVCEIEKELGKVVEVRYPELNITRNVISTTDSDPRQNNSRFTGYRLNGYGFQTASGSKESYNVGDACTAQGTEGKVVSVTSAGHTQVFAVYGGDKRLLAMY